MNNHRFTHNYFWTIEPLKSNLLRIYITETTYQSVSTGNVVEYTIGLAWTVFGILKQIFRN